jgi:hypothetical protein
MVIAMEMHETHIETYRGASPSHALAVSFGRIA